MSLFQLMEHLVSIRKSVKQKMAKETGLKYWELDIRQQALKLTANRFVFTVLGCAGDKYTFTTLFINVFLFILNTVCMDVWVFQIQDSTLSL